jgi:protein SCO1/2
MTKGATGLLTMLICLGVQPALAEKGHQHQAPTEQGAAHAEETGVRIAVPDVPLLDQSGQQVHFAELVKNNVVVINTIFTTCTTVCPLQGANFAQLEKLLAERARHDVRLISISVDPTTDTPERLKSWSEKFHAGPAWTLLTGAKTDVDHLLKALRLFTGDKADHSPAVLIGSGTTGQWRRAYALTSPQKLLEMIPGTRSSAAQNYFTDVILVDQHGNKLRFYSDLIKGNVVVINSFFTSCRSSCPVMAATLARIQEWLGDRMGKQVRFISLTLDPEVDTPERLRAFAGHLKAGPGWEFVTGSRENLEFALRKLGQYAEPSGDHSNVFIIGNERTGLWKKALGIAPAEQIIPIVDSVLNDPG